MAGEVAIVTEALVVLVVLQKALLRQPVQEDKR